jgi:hypothetical protein
MPAPPFRSLGQGLDDRLARPAAVAHEALRTSYVVSNHLGTLGPGDWKEFRSCACALDDSSPSHTVAAKNN